MSVLWHRPLLNVLDRSVRSQQGGRMKGLRVSSMVRLLVLAGLAASCSPDPSDPVRIPTTLEVDQPALDLEVGDFATLQATVFDQQGAPMSGIPVSWRSTNPGVITVSGGAVQAVGPGVASVIASTASLSDESFVNVTVPLVTIVVTNQLVRPVNVDVNGTVIGSVPAGQTAQQSMPAEPFMQVGWTVVPFTRTDGQPIGDIMSGVYPGVANPFGTLNYTANYQIGTQYFFAPAVNNTSGADLIIGVNMGLQSENRCVCVVPASGSNITLGYYRLFSNSNVRGYRANSNYSGGYIFWPQTGTSMPSVVTPGSGTVLLLATFPPPVAEGQAGPFALFGDAPAVRADSLAGPDDAPREGRLMPLAPALAVVSPVVSRR